MSEEPDQDRTELLEGRPMTLQEFRGHIRLLSAVLGFGVLVLVASLLATLEDVLKPLLLAVFLCYLIVPGVNALERNRVPRRLGYVIMIGGSFALLYLIGQIIASNALLLAENVPVYQATLTGYAEQLEALAIRYKLILPDQAWKLEDVLSYLPFTTITEVIGSSTSLFVSILANLVAVIFFVVFILLEAERFSDRVRLAFNDETAERILAVLENINADVQSYIFLKVIVSAITGVLSTITLAVVGLDLYLFVGMMTFILNFIPYLGSLLSVLMAVSIALVQFNSPLIALWLAIILALVQLGIGNLLEPRLQGQRLNLSPLLIVTALAFWAWLWGPLGMLLAVPITASLHIVLEQFEYTHAIAVMMSGRSTPNSSSEEP
ncbi:MAG: AI-2E family transporter [Myxococcota bacterium]